MRPAGGTSEQPVFCSECRTWTPVAAWCTCFSCLPIGADNGATVPVCAVLEREESANA